jgi:hypothetical protein
MKRRYLSFAITLVVGCAIVAAMAIGAGAPTVLANNTYQSLPYNLVWQAQYVTVEDDWSSAPGVLGFPGSDGNPSGTDRGAGADPQTVLDDMTSGVTPKVHANELSMSSSVAAAYSVVEFHPTTGGLTKATLALHANSQFDAPFLLYHINTTGMSAINIQYDVSDIDFENNTDALQQVALQYRIGNSGSFTNVPAGYIADATDPVGQPFKTTHVNATLPANANNQAQVQFRILTTNASGADEFIGIDNIAVTGTPSGGPTPTNTQPGPTPTNTQPGPTPTTDPSLTERLYLPVMQNQP